MRSARVCTWRGCGATANHQLPTPNCQLPTTKICGFLFHLDMLILGMMTAGTYAMASIVALVQVIASAGVGGMLYKE